MKGFRQRSNCSAHHRAVPLNMKETCPHCGKAFKKLKHHIRDVHAAKKLVKCDQCDKQYPEGRLFKDHMHKTHMSSINDEPLAKYLETTSCPVCGDTLLATRWDSDLFCESMYLTRLARHLLLPLEASHNSRSDLRSSRVDRPLHMHHARLNHVALPSRLLLCWHSWSHHRLTIWTNGTNHPRSWSWSRSRTHSRWST